MLKARRLCPAGLFYADPYLGVRPEHPYKIEREHSKNVFENLIRTGFVYGYFKILTR